MKLYVFQYMDIDTVSKAKDFIRKTVKRAFSSHEDDSQTPKRLVLEDDESLQIRNFMKIFGKYCKTCIILCYDWLINILFFI